MGKRIIVSVSNDLCTDLRVLKVCASLHNHGYTIRLIGRHRPNSFPLHLPYRYKRLRLLFNRGFLFYAELNFRLFVLLLFDRSNIYYANDTDTLPAHFIAASLRRKKLIFDAHEIFPEVPELQNRPVIKRIWETIEDYIFPRLKTNFTVCNSIAEYYNKKYGIHMHVLRNVPLLHEQPIEKRLFFPGKKILLYQGALNIGRGIEWVIDAMPFVPDAILYIIGDGDIRQQLMQKVKNKQLETKVIFHGRVLADELFTYTSSADIGLCLLENRGLNYYYALPNRVFTYLHAGVPILASPFPEIKQIVQRYDTGILTESHEPKELANIIQNMLTHPLNTSHFKSLSRQFCWEQEEKVLLKVLKQI